MRKTGKTTRAVDKAIQTLFEYGKIMILKYPKDTMKNFMSEEFIFEDEEITDKERRILFARILERLENEHEGQYEFEEQDLSIELKSYKENKAISKDGSFVRDIMKKKGKVFPEFIVIENRAYYKS